MAGRKGQRSGGHNKKSDEDHERDGTRSHVEESAVAAGALDGVLSSIGTDANCEMQRLYRIYIKAADAWDKDATDKEARLSACSALDRLLRIAYELARESPKDEAQPEPTGGPTLSMADLLRSRGGNGAS